MIKRLSYIFLGAMIGAVMVMVASNGAIQFGSAVAASSDTYRQLSIFGDIFERVRRQYVTEPKDEELVENAINGMLAALDPHSSYLNAKDFTDMRVQTKGQFGGLGIEVTMDKEVLKVVSPILDTPAFKAGILAGDLITKINNENVRGLSLQKAVEKMRGPVGTPIVVTIVREGADKPFEVTIIRDIIKVPAVHHRVERSNVGYIRISSFTEQTTSGLKRAIAEIRKEVGDDKLKGFILDLRLNPGGLLDQAVSVSDAFLERGEVVSTRGRDPDETRRYNAVPGDITGGKPLIVMMNGGSASASEIVAGALQDHKRATVLGTRSFGKGSVQTIIPLGSNGALRLTTALYYTPSGKSIQAKGIVPDIKVIQPLPDNLKGKIENRGEAQLRGHISNQQDEKEESGSSAYVPPDSKDDVQLGYALDLLEGAKQHAAFPPDPESALKTKGG